MKAPKDYVEWSGERKNDRRCRLCFWRKRFAKEDVLGVVFVIAVLLAFVAGSRLAKADTLSLNLYGLSHHFKGRADDYNEQNWGIGARYDWRETTRDVWLHEVGVYKDSKGRKAVYGVTGYQWKLWRRVWLGGAVGVFKSDSYAGGMLLPTALPIVTIDADRARLNLAFTPLSGGVMAAYLSIPFK